MIRIVIALAVLATRVHLAAYRERYAYAGQHCAPGQLNAT